MNTALQNDALPAVESLEYETPQPRRGTIFASLVVLVLTVIICVVIFSVAMFGYALLSISSKVVLEIVNRSPKAETMSFWNGQNTRPPQKEANWGA